ncbi:ATP-binding protein [Thalassospiraceae bacterium LMO-JJ14]|nr:ATP-binding protein [Thalassospiraceae bacterium LMO-JJ14]
MANSDHDSTSKDEVVRALRDEIETLRVRLDQVEADAVFAEAMENSSEAIVIYDDDGKLVACNQNFRDLYGYSAEEAKKGVHFAKLGRIDIERGNVVIGDEFGGGDEYLERKAEYRRKLSGSFVVRLKDGRWIKTVDRRMQRGGFVSVQVDITDIKKNEQNLRTAMEAAEKATQVKSEFLANISHDLRTPLNAIIGFSEMIRSELLGPMGHAGYMGYVDDINESGQLLLSIVNDILDTAQLESGRLSLSRNRFDAIKMSKDIVRRIEPITASKKLSVSIEKAEDFPEIICTDQRATVQILNNLISNAARHSDEGAAIAIEWCLAESGDITLSVTDAGEGMTPLLLEKIGDPFLQDGTYATHPGEKGAGLGLYICKKLITAMGGDMDIESILGKGTRVTMHWPADCIGPGYCT